MKTQNTINVFQQNTEVINHETFVTRNNTSVSNTGKANLSSADLWNILRHRKTGTTYRKHM